MTTPDRNAAIWYAADGYDPQTAGINGRRVAGASFLEGFFNNADVDEFVSVTHGNKGAEAFKAQAASIAPSMPHRAVYERAAHLMDPVGTLFFPAPNYAEQCWRRQSYGADRYSICGITHTTATQAVMRGIADLRAGPQAEWDAVICTSKSVHAATARNMDLADAFLKDRFGRLPARPQMPIIPLGLTADAYAHDPEAAVSFRKRLNLKGKDVAVVTIARLLPYGKFDPGPVFVAMQQAQERLGARKQLHFVACGLYADNHSQRVFEACAEAFMPDVPFHHLPGDDAQMRRETLSGGDVFAFLIDNVQETFGLSPIEAMAAGLPVIASDWDGMKDTVTPDVGMRIPTRLVSAAASMPEAHGYLSGSLSYAQYSNRLSMMTDVDVRAAADAFYELGKSKALRKKLGQAGIERAQSVYDWRVIIPQMQDLWQELSAIRQRANTTIARFNPSAPLPGDLFGSYPSDTLDMDTDRLVASADGARLQQVFETRRYTQIGKPAEKLVTLRSVLDAVHASGDVGVTPNDLAGVLKWNPRTVERAVLFLLKYDCVRISA